jgi:hypothetical protein
VWVFVYVYVCVCVGGGYVPWRQVQLETRLRIEKEKLDEINKVCESKDEQIAHLRRYRNTCNLVVLL